MLDSLDTRLVQLLQRQGDATASELAEVLNLSPSQAARRRTRLEEEGVITGYAARLDPARIGLAVQAFLQVQMAAHNPETHQAFLRLIATLPQVAGAWTLTGETDFLLRVWCADLAALNDLVHHRLLPHPAVARVQSQIVMDQPKADTGLPV